MAEGAAAFPTWPPGTSEMARAIREHDWCATPLGPIESWPQPLRSVVDLILPAGFPMIALWGRDLIQIYNDPYRAIIGRKHPLALGQPTRQCFPEIWHINEPIYERVCQGETVTREDALYPLARHDGLEDAWFTLSYSPIRDDDCGIAGVLVTLVETTERVLETRRRAEAVRALRRSEESFRGFVTSASDVVYRMSPDWTTLLDFAGESLPLDAQDAGGRWLSRYVAPEDRRMVRAAASEARRRLQPFDVEHRFVRDDGSLGWVHSRATPVFDDHGRVTEWLGTAKDVTLRRESEERLRAANEQLRALGDASSDVLSIRDALTFGWTYLSPAFERVYGLPREEALRGNSMQNWLALIIPEDRARAETFIRSVGHGEQITFEYRIRRPSDGAIHLVRNTDFPIRDADGQIVCIGGVSHDATQERVSHTALVASERRLRTLMEGVPQLIWRAVDSGRWVWASPQWTARTGQTPEQSRDWGWLAAVHPEDRTLALEAWDEAEASGELRLDLRIRDVGSGAYHWHQTRATAVRDEQGALVEWLGTSIDVEEMRHLQEHLGALVGDLQHRSRNLMGVVRSLGEQTLRSSKGIEDFGPRFRDSMGALARAQELLSRRGEGQGATFDELIAGEVAALGDVAQEEGKVVLRGPKGVTLPAAAVQSLALALHELATDAQENGALSQPEGRLTVKWMIAREQGRTWLHVDWRERGVTMPSRRRRSGQERPLLVEEALPRQTEARTTYQLQPDGVHCTITLPTSERTGS